MSENAKHQLSERKKRILKAIVDAHIVDGEPVGSKYIMQDEHLNCSSATIRNEMAELEALGYLEQPHTSAGRVPSELGYRFYVDSLIESYAMTTKEITEINKLLKSKMNELDQILLAASKLAGNLTNYTSFVIKPKASSVSIKRFDVIYVDRHSLLLVMISDGGAVVTKHLSIEQGVSQMTATDLAMALNDHIAGLTANEITLPIIVELENAMGDKAGIVNPIIKIVYESMNELDGGDLKVSGMDLTRRMGVVMEVHSSEIREAVKPALNQILLAIARTLERTPPEISSDLYDFGLVLTGGSALLPGLSAMIGEQLGMRARIAKRPMENVCMGMLRIIDSGSESGEILRFRER